MRPSFTLNDSVVRTSAPPIPLAQAWAASYDGALGPLLNLSQGVPGTPPPPPFLEALADAARMEEATRYGDIAGDRTLRTALAKDFNEAYAARVSEEEIAVTAGCNAAFYTTMLALCPPGSSIILPTPYYFNHAQTLSQLRINNIPLPCSAHDHFIPSASVAASLIDSSTRAIVLVTPNNPCGVSYPAATVLDFVRLARERNIALVLDSTYCSFLPKGQSRPHDLLAEPKPTGEEGSDWRETVVQLHSCSKDFAIPGHRIGAIVAGKEFLAQALKISDCFQICPARPAQIALASSLPSLIPFRQATREALAHRSSLFLELIARVPGWSVSSAGGYYAFVRFPEAYGADVTSEEVARRLAGETGVVVLPGSFFSDEGARGDADKHVRVSIANVGDEAILGVEGRLRALNRSFGMKDDV